MEILLGFFFALSILLFIVVRKKHNKALSEKNEVQGRYQTAHGTLISLSHKDFQEQQDLRPLVLFAALLPSVETIQSDEEKASSLQKEVDELWEKVKSLEPQSRRRSSRGGSSSSRRRDDDDYSSRSSSSYDSGSSYSSSSDYSSSSSDSYSGGGGDSGGGGSSDSY